MMQRRFKLFVVLCLAAVPVFGYVGPGAGFAFIGSFFLIIAAFFLALFNLITLPFRMLWRLLRRYRTMRRAQCKRAVIIGFDGMDQQLLLQLKAAGFAFPAFDRVAQSGNFAPLLSTEPPISPVAWSTFATGVNPGKHNIFDFLTNDKKTYLAKLSGSDIIPTTRTLRFGSWQIPLRQPRIELMRKSRSFWQTIGAHGIHASVSRVPYTFPPEKLNGEMLSGLGTPDLRGSQGSFTVYSVENKTISAAADGMWSLLQPQTDGSYRGQISGPAHPFKKDSHLLTIPFTITLTPDKQAVQLACLGQTIDLQNGCFSPWQQLTFKAGPFSIHGIAQWLLTSLDPLQLYLSPIHIDPEKPVMPISHPKIFSVYHAKRLGPYATLGMAEDTWAVNEGIITPEHFLVQMQNAQREREAIFYDTIAKVKQGLIVAVFEETDRVQHMFWKSLRVGKNKQHTPNHPIIESYQRMDAFLQTVLDKLKKDDLLMIVSDHGFNSFTREFHLNAWLLQEGYLVLQAGKTTGDKWFADVDWSRSRAYGQGLNGLVINQAGREAQGIVKPGADTENLKRELQKKLQDLEDSQNKKRPIKHVFLREEIYHGAYLGNAPDLVIGYAIGYRVSWDSAVSAAGAVIFTDNARYWSGDHAFTRDQVPGIFFCNRKIKGKNPTLADIAPTLLTAFGIAIPAYIDGRDLQIDFSRK